VADHPEKHPPNAKNNPAPESNDDPDTKAKLKNAPPAEFLDGNGSPKVLASAEGLSQTAGHLNKARFTFTVIAQNKVPHKPYHSRSLKPSSNKPTFRT